MTKLELNNLIREKAPTNIPSIVQEIVRLRRFSKKRVSSSHFIHERFQRMIAKVNEAVERTFDGSKRGSVGSFRQ
jgi:hypothetical protein